MRWTRVDAYAALSADPDGFAINLANVGELVAYMAVRLGERWKPGPDGTSRGWDGSTILRVDRVQADDRDARDAAWRACVAACEESARVR